MQTLEHNDYKSIRKAPGLTPKEWIDLQKLAITRGRDKLYHRGELKVLSCLCRSPWCKKCAKSAPAAGTIRERLSALNWRATRQVVLTVKRDKPPEEYFSHIRKRKAIARLVKSMNLSNCRWLWVLEFHRGGFPHWHLFIETTPGKEGMIGKRFIQKRWKHGIVWETYAQSKDHWGAICGYHQKNGYFAAETKAHQLELPEYLLNETRVRKFASNFKSPEEILRKPKTPAKVPPTADVPTIKRIQKVYKERLLECNTKAKVCKDGGWLEVPISGNRLRELAEEKLERINYKTYRGSNEDIIDLVVEVS